MAFWNSQAVNNLTQKEGLKLKKKVTVVISRDKAGYGSLSLGQVQWVPAVWSRCFSEDGVPGEGEVDARRRLRFSLLFHMGRGWAW